MTSDVTGWLLAGSRPDCYEIGVAVDDAYVGKRIAYLRSIAHPEGGFGTLMQEIAPDEFIGQRIRFSAAVRTESLNNWAGLWMRVDGVKARSPLAFDNMDRRAGLRGG